MNPHRSLQGLSTKRRDIEYGVGLEKACLSDCRRAVEVECNCRNRKNHPGKRQSHRKRMLPPFRVTAYSLIYLGCEAKERSLSRRRLQALEHVTRHVSKGGSSSGDAETMA